MAHANAPACEAVHRRTGRGSRARPGGSTDDIGLHEQPARTLRGGGSSDNIGLREQPARRPPAEGAPAASPTTSDCTSSRRPARIVKAPLLLRHHWRIIGDNQLIGSGRVRGRRRWLRGTMNLGPPGTPDRRHGFPRSHGPAKGSLKPTMVNARLTPLPRPHGGRRRPRQAPADVPSTSFGTKTVPLAQRAVQLEQGQSPPLQGDAAVVRRPSPSEPPASRNAGPRRAAARLAIAARAQCGGTTAPRRCGRG